MPGQCPFRKILQCLDLEAMVTFVTLVSDNYQSDAYRLVSSVESLFFIPVSLLTDDENFPFFLMSSLVCDDEAQTEIFQSPASTILLTK